MGGMLGILSLVSKILPTRKELLVELQMGLWWPWGLMPGILLNPISNSLHGDNSQDWELLCPPIPRRSDFPASHDFPTVETLGKFGNFAPNVFFHVEEAKAVEKDPLRKFNLSLRCCGLGRRRRRNVLPSGQSRVVFSCPRTKNFGINPGFASSSPLIFPHCSDASIRLCQSQSMFLPGKTANKKLQLPPNLSHPPRYLNTNKSDFGAKNGRFGVVISHGKPE